MRLLVSIVLLVCFIQDLCGLVRKPDCAVVLGRIPDYTLCVRKTPEIVRVPTYPVENLERDSIRIVDIFRLKTLHDQLNLVAHAQVSAYGVFPTKDGKVVLAPANDALFRKLLSVLGRNDLLKDERYATNASRVAHRSEVDAIIADATGEWLRDDLLDACAKAAIPAGPINDLDEGFDDPQVKTRGMCVEIDGMPSVRSPFVFSNAELALDKASPGKGKDNP